MSLNSADLAVEADDLFQMPGIEPEAPRVSQVDGLEVHGDDRAFLRGKTNAVVPGNGEALSFVDFFSGCGGLSLGVSEAAKSLGLRPLMASAVDNMQAARDVYAANFGGDRAVCADLSELMPRDSTTPLTDYERSVLSVGGNRLGVVVGGPPCQGHSDLNNYTRRDDPKNELYLYMGRAGHALRPQAILIENVAGSPHDKGGVVGRTIQMLEAAGYNVDAGLVDLSTLGVAQTRRRYLILGTLRESPGLSEILRSYRVSTRNLSWAIEDLVDAPETGIDSTPSKPSKDNARRIDYLFDNDLRDLPNSERPPCHRDKAHSYSSVYGRLEWAKPAPTITGGFFSMCMGRYVHPSRRRTLTAREAARIQFFPDTFDFDAAGSRTSLAKIIGNAVPMKLTYSVVSELLRLGVVVPGDSHA